MGGDEVKLLGAWPSPYVLRARIALNIKSVDYEFLEEKFGSKSDLLLKSNPVHKKIPVLIHGDRPICESLIIVEYIDQVWPSGPSLLPSDPYDRAIARFWAAYADQWFSSAIVVLYEDDGEKAAAAVEEAKKGLSLFDEALVKCSKGQNFFGGDRMGYLDIALGSLLSWIKVIQILRNVSLIDESTTPNLFRWAPRFAADHAVKDVFPDIHKHLEFAKFLVARTKAQP
ncbi:glutathione S-transferase TAU 18 [Perilla frutescens var. hirtella]|uniref:Glutathione S-transferase n=1 Tax=Perilla frutescens var. hirtella TaxID=608512 RepID=A0AAD4IPH5_PERFH|nr:glutathione S-transferase TAU 18 [Perilla frutescens var. hirtella]KAH6815681.1 glutathione S-transferase TAU 18 [Perilla frutescens var. frutescens]